MLRGSCDNKGEDIILLLRDDIHCLCGRLWIGDLKQARENTTQESN